MPKPKFIKELKTTLPVTRGKTTELVKRKSAIILNDIRDAKILISRIVYQLQTGKIETGIAKAILYATGCYIQAYREAELEDRLRNLEGKILDIEGVAFIE